MDGASTAVASRPNVLVFAGLDPSGGAGIAADLQALAGQGVHALTVVTALTVQDNDRVYRVQPVDVPMLQQQAQALIAKMEISAVKIGIPGSAVNARAIAELVAVLRRRQPDLPVVLDPVLASGHGDALSRGGAAAALEALASMLPLATVITPNGPEAQALSDATQPLAQAQYLQARGCAHVFITGGHDGGDDIVNRWYGPGARNEQDHHHAWRWPRLPGEFHGSGCTLSSAIAGQLALGLPTMRALELAQEYCHAALRDAYAIAPGQRIPLR